MATKKADVVNNELKNAGLMEILAADGNTKVFTQNTLVDYCYPTGIAVIDYALGYKVNVRDVNGGIIKQRTCIGLQAGSFDVITGPTQSFKTTMGIQISSNIAFSNGGNIIHLDAENRLSLQRVKTLTRLPEDWFEGEFPRYQIKNGAIGYDTLQEYITEIYERKMHRAL